MKNRGFASVFAQVAVVIGLACILLSFWSDQNFWRLVWTGFLLVVAALVSWAIHRSQTDIEDIRKFNEERK